MNKKQYIILASVVGVILVSIIAVLLYQNHQQKVNLADMEEMMEFQKEQLEDEYEDLAMQYDGYQVNISNDSLADLLSKEQQRVQDLLEELRITKATNARRIKELKKELATVRAVMVEYVHQIDSLDRQNKQLVQENREVRRQVAEVTQANQSLTEERNQLHEVVTRASIMEVGQFSCTPLDKRDRKTSNFNKIVKLQLQFSVLKNITTQAGNKTVYLRLIQPNGEALLKDATRTFRYENGKVPYSLKSDFEYGGEQVDLTLYWPVEEVLEKGIYNAEFFIDGNQVGSFPFQLK